MSTLQTTQENIRVKPVGSALPAWWLVFIRELTELWIGGKGLSLMLIYSIVLGGMVYVFSSNSELSLIPPKESVYEMLKNAMAISLFMDLIIGADTLSGERDRATSNRCSSPRAAADKLWLANSWLASPNGRQPS